MKKLCTLVWMFSLCILITSCTSSPTPKTTTPSAGIGATPLSPAEQKSYGQALSQLSNGKSEKAENILVKLTDAHPGNLGLWINLANAAYQNNHLDLAEKALNHAQPLQPNVAEYYNISGLVAVARGKYKEAEKHYIAALKLNDNEANAHYNLALLYDVFFQDIRNAIPHYERYLALINQADEETANWLEELKLNVNKGSNE